MNHLDVPQYRPRRGCVSIQASGGGAVRCVRSECVYLHHGLCDALSGMIKCQNRGLHTSLRSQRINAERTRDIKERVNNEEIDSYEARDIMRI